MKAAGQGIQPAPTLLPWVLLTVAGLELAARFTGLRAIQIAAYGAMVLVILLSLRRLGTREIYLIAVSAALTVLVIVTQQDAATVLQGALDQAVFLMAFILLLSLLQAAASTSPSIAITGEYLTRQPPGRRYIALGSGTSVLAVLFNLGIVSFLVPLIQRGIQRAAPGDALNPIREQRQITALLRGFAWSVTWSPTALAPLIVADLLPGVERSAWIGYGFALFLSMMAIGWLEDRIKFRAYKPQGLRAVMAFPQTAALRFFATTGWFLILMLGFMWLFDESAVFGVLAACPIMVIGWVAAQIGLRRSDLIPTLKDRLRDMIRSDLPGSVNVAVTLAASGFIGRAAAGLTPATEVAEALGLSVMPDWLLLALIPPFLSVISLLALSPTMMAVFMGSFFAALPVLPADATLLAFSISCGWALSMTFSPFATVVLLIARGSGIPATTLTWGWSLGFTLIAAVLLFPVFYLLTGGT